MASGTFRWVCDERRTKVRLVRRTPWRRRSRSGSSSPPRSRRGRGARNPSRCCRRSRFGMTDKWPRTFDLEKGPRKDWGFCKGVVTRAYRKGWPRSRWTPLKKWRNCFNKVKDVFFSIRDLFKIVFKVIPGYLTHDPSCTAINVLNCWCCWSCYIHNSYFT